MKEDLNMKFKREKKNIFFKTPAEMLKAEEM